MHKFHLHRISVLAKACAFLLLVACNQNSSDCNKIPTLTISEHHLGWDKKTHCTLLYSDCETNDTLKAKAKYRGENSSKFDKHSLSIEFDKKQAFHQ